MSDQKLQRIGFIGFGEAAYEIAKGLKSEGDIAIFAYDKYLDDPVMGAKIRNRAMEAGVELTCCVEDLAGKSKVLISAVVSAVAVAVAESASGYLTPEHIYVDLNSASPKTKVEAQRAIERSGAKFVDLAIMGPVPTFKHKVPGLASGSGAKEATQLLSAAGMNVKYVSDKAGDTSSIKMLRSIFMKGAAALLIEMLSAAEKCGATETVLDSVIETLSEVQPKALVKRLVTGTAIHSERRAHEMVEVMETLEFLNSPHGMSEATKQVLDWVTALKVRQAFNNETPDSPFEVVKKINELSRQ